LLRSRRAFLFLLAIAVTAAIFYFAPNPTPEGMYQATLTIQNGNLTDTAQFAFNLTSMISESLATKTSLTGTHYRFDVTYRQIYNLSPGKKIETDVAISDLQGEPVTVQPADASMTLSDTRFVYEVTIGPSAVAENRLTFSYTPLFRSKEVFSLFALVAVLWLTEVVPLGITSLLFAVSMVVLGIRDAAVVLAPFFDPIVALLLGGFILASALSKYGVDAILTSRLIKFGYKDAKTFLFVSMLTSAALSMWIPNTTATIIMLPLIRGNLKRLRGAKEGFIKATLIAVAYASNIGGIGTLIGTTTPPIAAGSLRNFLRMPVTFTDWLPFGLTTVAVMLPMTYLVLVRLFKVKGTFQEVIELERIPFRRGQAVTTGIFALTILLWVTESIHGIPSGIVALIGCVLIFVFGLLDSDDLRRIDWNTLLLIGGALSLGSTIFATGVGDWLALQLSGLEVSSHILILLAAGALSLALTQFVSNTAAAALLAPVYIPLAISMGVDPKLLVIMACGIVSSLAFMFPFSTPPNAIVFGTGGVKLRDMVNAGILVTALSLPLATIVLPYLWSFLGLVRL